MKNKKQDVTKAIETAKNGLEYAVQTDIIKLTPELEIIENIRNTVIKCLQNKTNIPRFQNLYPLIASINLMMISHKKISKNDGATSPGSEGESVEDFSLYKMQKLAEQINNKTFKWKTIKKVEILRPPKDPRPLGVINYSEKIIQNNIQFILEAIYDPIFEHQNSSLGFRPHKSCKDCILIISYPINQGLQWVIEGDIKGAFDNVHPPKLAKILSERIDDKDFINLIYEACITKTIKKTQNNTYITEESLEGIPQGSIISPTLFNIYMHTFDLEVIKILENTKYIHSPNKSITKRIPSPKAYNNISNKILKLRKYKTNINIENIKLQRNLNNTEKSNIKDLKIQIDKQIKIRYSYPRIEYSKVPFRYCYNRYADDFVILVNKDKSICEEIILLLAEYLKTLKLTLSKEKTIITDLTKNRVYYLGYSLFISNKRFSKTYESKFIKTQKTKFPTRGGKQILVGIHLDRVYNKLIKKNYAIPKSLEPTHNSALAKLEDQEIIEIFNSTIRGIYNYYYDTILYKSQLNRIHYILYYSAIKTLALKYHTTSAKIFKRFGWKEFDNHNKPTGNTRIVKPYQTTIKTLKGENTKKHFALLINLHDINIISKDLIYNSKLAIYSKLPIRYEDIWLRYKINWRTTFKMTKFCNICGSNEFLESHHIRKISGPTIDKKDSFTQNIMRNLNRKQLIVCRACHNKIHAGKYSGLSLKDLYDIRTIKIENQLLAETFWNNHADEGDDPIPEYPQIIFNSEFKKIRNIKFYRTK